LFSFFSICRSNATRSWKQLKTDGNLPGRSTTTLSWKNYSRIRT
jgi:hypothetical protein